MNIFKWFSPSIPKIGFEDIKYALDNYKNHMIINTLPLDEQYCLIKNTVLAEREEYLINQMIENYETKTMHILIYGKHAADNSSEQKFHQLSKLGFTEIYIYSGGMFEWLLLQDIYGSAEFPTTKKCLDILKYKSPKVLQIPRIGYY